MKYRCRDCGQSHNRGKNSCDYCGSIYLIPNNFVVNKLRKEKETLGSRFLSGVFLSVLVGLTIILIPIFIMLKGADAGAYGTGRSPILYAIYTKSWFIYTMGISAFTGFILGSDKTFTFLGHMWGTEKPGNLKITGLIWFILIITCYLSYKYVT